MVIVLFYTDIVGCDFMYVKLIDCVSCCNYSSLLWCMLSDAITRFRGEAIVDIDFAIEESSFRSVTSGMVKATFPAPLCRDGGHGSL